MIVVNPFTAISTILGWVIFALVLWCIWRFLGWVTRNRR